MIALAEITKLTTIEHTATFGKVTLPARDPDGNIISTIGYITSDGESTPLGMNITYVFCEKDSNYVRTIEGVNNIGSFVY